MRVCQVISISFALIKALEKCMIKRSFFNLNIYEITPFRVALIETCFSITINVDAWFDLLNILKFTLMINYYVKRIWNQMQNNTNKIR